MASYCVNTWPGSSELIDLREVLKRLLDIGEF